MKKLLAIVVLVLAPLLAGAQQQKDVTKFLGIPVDGTKAEMIQKLKEKGFRADPHIEDDLLGEFNGSNVRVIVQTNKNKVSRIIVSDYNGSSETTVKIKYNNLCSQFEYNPRYISASETAQTIPEEEDISYEISVHDKRYDAVFYQVPESADFRQPDTVKGGEQIKDYMSQYEEQKKKGNINVAILLGNFILDTMKNVVWFTIKEFHGEYMIVIYYENGYNMANGEDL